MKFRLPARVTVIFERREDGGLAAYGNGVPAFVLSHSDPKAVLADVIPALEGILSHVHGTSVVIERLAESIPTQREYITLAA
jgi:hypothetical protein